MKLWETLMIDEVVRKRVEMKGETNLLIRGSVKDKQNIK